MRRRAWYKSAEYKQPMEKRTLGDGSTVEVVEVMKPIDGRNLWPVFALTRIYPWGFEQVIIFQILSNGETKYLDIGPGPEAHNKQPAKAFEEALQNGEVRITARGAIPGQGISNTYDEATRKHYTQSAEFEREYDQMHLARAMKSDHSTMHRGGQPGYNGSAGTVEAFDGTPGVAPPIPRRS